MNSKVTTVEKQMEKNLKKTRRGTSMLGAGPGTYVPPTAMGVAKHLDELHRCAMTSLDGSA